MAEKKDVAIMMLTFIKDRTRLDQEVAVRLIREQFGEDFLYRNANGNFAIDKGVLKEFRKLTEDTVVWDRGYREWRLRRDHDPKGTRQVD